MQAWRCLRKKSAEVEAVSADIFLPNGFKEAAWQQARIKTKPSPSWPLSKSLERLTALKLSELTSSFERRHGISQQQEFQMGLDSRFEQKLTHVTRQYHESMTASWQKPLKLLDSSVKQLQNNNYRPANYALMALLNSCLGKSNQRHYYHWLLY